MGQSAWHVIDDPTTWQAFSANCTFWAPSSPGGPPVPQAQPPAVDFLTEYVVVGIHNADICWCGGLGSMGWVAEGGSGLQGCGLFQNGDCDACLGGTLMAGAVVRGSTSSIDRIEACLSG
jgi:hypothetical protein